MSRKIPPLSLYRTRLDYRKCDVSKLCSKALYLIESQVYAGILPSDWYSLLPLRVLSDRNCLFNIFSPQKIKVTLTSEIKIPTLSFLLRECCQMQLPSIYNIYHRHI